MNSNRSLGAELLDAARARGDKPVIVEYTGRDRHAACSGREFVALVREVGQNLNRCRVGAGMRAALCLPNSTLYAAALTALMEREIVVAPLKLEYRATELAAVFRDLQPHLVISDPAFLSILAPHLRRLHPSPVVLVSRGLGFETLSGLPGGETASGGNGSDTGIGATARVSDDASGAAPEQIAPIGPYPDAELSLPDDVVSINFTYRGYGYPLGAMLTAQQYRQGAAGVAEGIEIERCRNVGLMLPMSHIYGLVTGVVLPLLYSVPAVVVATAHPRRAIETFAAERISFLPVVPELGEALCRFAPEDGSGIGVDLLALGGSALSSEQFERFRERVAAEVINGYGLTEFTPVAMHARSEARAGTIGKPLRGLETQCAGQDGELLLRGDGVALGYYRRSRETGEAFDKDGWFHTGDICRYNGNELVFVREKKATCKANGLMVDLVELRAVIKTCEWVEEADLRYADDGVTATVEVGDRLDRSDNGGERSDEAARELRRGLVRFLKPRLAGYKIPKVINVKSR